jgi:hypothetical protein
LHIDDINGQHYKAMKKCDELLQGKQHIDTRWSSHYKTLKSLVHLFPTIIKVLDIVSKDDRDWENRDHASNLQVYFQSFDSIFYLHLMLHILTITDCLSQALQRKDQDIVNAIRCVRSTRDYLTELIAHGWQKILQDTYAFCDLHDTTKLEM